MPYGVTKEQYMYKKILDLQGCWASEVLDRPEQVNRNFNYWIAGKLIDKAPDNLINYTVYEWRE